MLPYPFYDVLRSTPTAATSMDALCTALGKLPPLARTPVALLEHLGHGGRLDELGLQSVSCTRDHARDGQIVLSLAFPDVKVNCTPEELADAVELLAEVSIEDLCTAHLLLLSHRDRSENLARLLPPGTPLPAFPTADSQLHPRPELSLISRAGDTQVRLPLYRVLQADWQAHTLATLPREKVLVLATLFNLCRRPAPEVKYALDRIFANYKLFIEEPCAEATVSVTHTGDHPMVRFGDKCAAAVTWEQWAEVLSLTLPRPAPAAEQPAAQEVLTQASLARRLHGELLKKVKECMDWGDLTLALHYLQGAGKLGDVPAPANTELQGVGRQFVPRLGSGWQRNAGAGAPSKEGLQALVAKMAGPGAMAASDLNTLELALQQRESSRDKGYAKEAQGLYDPSTFALGRHLTHADVQARLAYLAAHESKMGEGLGLLRQLEQKKTVASFSPGGDRALFGERAPAATAVGFEKVHTFCQWMGQIAGLLDDEAIVAPRLQEPWPGKKESWQVSMQGARINVCLDDTLVLRCKLPADFLQGVLESMRG